MKIFRYIGLFLWKFFTEPMAEAEQSEFQKSSSKWKKEEADRLALDKQRKRDFHRREEDEKERGKLRARYEAKFF